MYRKTVFSLCSFALLDTNLLAKGVFPYFSTLMMVWACRMALTRTHLHHRNVVSLFQELDLIGHKNSGPIFQQPWAEEHATRCIMCLVEGLLTRSPWATPGNCPRMWRRLSYRLHNQLLLRPLL